MADPNAVAGQILSQIQTELTSHHGPSYAERIRDLTEAYAWVSRPDQAHGGHSTTA